MVHILWLIAKYVAHFDSSWHYLDDRPCVDTKWIPHGTVLADWYNTRTDIAVVYNWTAVVQWTRKFCDSVILKIIARRQFRELARSKSNIEGGALHTRHRQWALECRQRYSPFTLLLRADTGFFVSPQSPISGGPRACAWVWKRFERVMLLVQIEHHDEAHAHHRSRQRDTIGFFPRSR